MKVIERFLLVSGVTIGGSRRIVRLFIGFQQQVRKVSGGLQRSFREISVGFKADWF